MFEDSLLIIKSDYMHKRKPVLLTLLQKEFQIQGRRRLRFTPELAAEFYKGEDESKSFMLLVIMLSKGNSEAIILTKQNCVEELMNTMVCYFGTSVEMERNVHVSRTSEDARREITFIFPNYIHEPIPSFMKAKFSNNPLLSEMLTEAYDIISGATGYPQNWKAKLADWLARSNSTLPIISNQCSNKPYLLREDRSTLATQPPEPCVKAPEIPTTPSGPSLSLTSAGSSMMMTSSSCITCSCFDGEDTCYKPPEKEDTFELYVKKKTAGSLTSGSEEHVCEDQGIEWVEIIEDESQEGEEELEIASDHQQDAEKLEEAAEVQSIEDRGSVRASVEERKSSVEQAQEEVVPTETQAVDETPPPKEPTPPPPEEAAPPPTEEVAPVPEEAAPVAAEVPPVAEPTPPPPPEETPPPPPPPPVEEPPTPAEAPPPPEEAPAQPEEAPAQDQPQAE